MAWLYISRIDSGLMKKLIDLDLGKTGLKIQTKLDFN